MDNWGVVEVIIALSGLFICVAKPLISNTKTIERLIVTMENLSNDLNEVEARNDSSHRRIYGRLDEQEEQLGDHEMRIKIVERVQGIESKNKEK